jgi:hypothetical protein
LEENSYKKYLLKAEASIEEPVIVHEVAPPKMK